MSTEVKVATVKEIKEYISKKRKRIEEIKAETKALDESRDETMYDIINQSQQVTYDESVALQELETVRLSIKANKESRERFFSEVWPRMKLKQATH